MPAIGLFVDEGGPWERVKNVKTAKTYHRGEARVCVVSDSGWHSVTVADESGAAFGYEVAAYCDRKLATAHAREVRRAFNMRARRESSASTR